MKINEEIYRQDQQTKFEYFRAIRNNKRFKKKLKQKINDEKVKQLKLEKWLNHV